MGKFAEKLGKAFPSIFEPRILLDAEKT